MSFSAYQPNLTNRAPLSSKTLFVLGVLFPVGCIPLHRSLASDGGKTLRINEQAPPRAPFVSFAYVGQKQLLLLLQYQRVRIENPIGKGESASQPASEPASKQSRLQPQIRTQSLNKPLELELALVATRCVLALAFNLNSTSHFESVHVSP